MVLTTELLPLSKAVVAIGSSLLLTSAAYEYVPPTSGVAPSPLTTHRVQISLVSLVSLNPWIRRYFRETHQTVPSMSPEWVSATQNMRAGHVHRVASPVDVELNPARRLREQAKKTKDTTIDMGGWF